MKKGYHVCLDPGHGPGCANRSPDGVYEEQELSKDLANRIASLLRERGITITFTRHEKDYPSLRNRCEVANAICGLDLFVSLHSNASGNGGWSDACGHLVFTSGAGDSERRNRAARAILQNWEQDGIPLGLNPLRHQAFTVLTNTLAPAVLLEHGFHTNRKDVAMLNDSRFRDRLAQADAKGILEYLGLSWQLSPNPDRAKVAKRFGLEKQTLDYLEAYSFGTDLLHKLAEGR